MRSTGFPVSRKDGEKRRAILPEDIKRITHPELLFFEEGYGEPLGISDSEYIATGANIVSHEETLAKDIICEPKAGEADYLDRISGKVVFGWIHAVQNKDICDALAKGGNSVYAWEDMFDENGIHSFFMNNRLAGKAAIKHACECCGISLKGKRAAVTGRGNCAKGATAFLEAEGAEVKLFYRNEEETLREEIGSFDLIVNAVRWDPTRHDHIIYRKDLSRMKKEAVIIDISCDRNGGIETSVPTSISNPIYIVDGITHYVVDNTPSLLFEEASREISRVLPPFLNLLAEGASCRTLDNALIIDEGRIADQKIIDYQKAAGVL